MVRKKLSPEEVAAANKKALEDDQKYQDAKYKAWREQYPDEPYHAGWDKGYDIKGFEEGNKGTSAPSTKAKGGKVKKMAKGGSTASKRADGCATKGKTKGKFV